MMQKIKQYQPQLTYFDDDSRGVSLSYKEYVIFEEQKLYLNNGLPHSRAFRTEIIVNSDKNLEPDFIPILAVNPNFETDIDAFTGVDGLGKSLKQMLNQVQYSALFAPIVEQDVTEDMDFV